MPITTQVEIVSAEKPIFSGVAEMVVATGALGELGISPGHAPLLTLLKPGEVCLTLPGGLKEVYYLSGGLLEVQAFCVTILADEAERADSLDEAAALAAKAKAEACMAKKDEEFDYSVAAAELARAAAQIRAIKKARKYLK